MRLTVTTSTCSLSAIRIIPRKQAKNANEDAGTNKSDNNAPKQAIADIDAKYSEEPSTNKCSNQAGNDISNDPIANPAPHYYARQKARNQSNNQPPDQTLKSHFSQNKTCQCHSVTPSLFLPVFGKDEFQDDECNTLFFFQHESCSLIDVSSF